MGRGGRIRARHSTAAFLATLPQSRTSISRISFPPPLPSAVPPSPLSAPAPTAAPRPAHRHLQQPRSPTAHLSPAHSGNPLAPPIAIHSPSPTARSPGILSNTHTSTSTPRAPGLLDTPAQAPPVGLPSTSALLRYCPRPNTASLRLRLRPSNPQPPSLSSTPAPRAKKPRTLYAIHERTRAHTSDPLTPRCPRNASVTTV